MIIPEKIEKQDEIQKIEIPAFYARKRVIGLATILNELATNYTIWSYYAREQTMIYSNCRETRLADMEEIRQWVLSLLKPNKTGDKSYKAKLYLNRANGKLLQNYRTQISASQPAQNATEKTISFQLSTWNRKYLQDSKKTKAKIMEDKA
ncbi:hypothetical protein H5410_056676 [Solanum commersonii]|uniref:Uncharacterized protein n=1 Tax=Solanum commersonii TaxID=4109 RepID=A0A9J5WNS8_SOLCO|nr:hypothetical protein H5410_056676 [Solanum commersonii]